MIKASYKKLKIFLMPEIKNFNSAFLVLNLDEFLHFDSFFPDLNNFQDLDNFPNFLITFYYYQHYI